MSATQVGGNSGEELLKLVRNGETDKVRALLRREPGIARVKDVNGASAILLAVYHGHAEMLPAFEEAGVELDFWEACAGGRTDRVRSLLAREPDLVDRPAPDGYTPLGLAVFFGHDALAGLLMERGADVNAAARNAQRVAPLHAAVARRNARMVRTLLERGADVDAEQAAGFTPLHAAAFHGDREIASLLLERGADPGKKSEDGKTAADLAAERGHAELAQWLAARSR